MPNEDAPQEPPVYQENEAARDLYAAARDITIVYNYHQAPASLGDPVTVGDSLQSAEAESLAVPIVSEPIGGADPEPTPAHGGRRWLPHFKRRRVAIAALIAVVCGGLGTLGAELASEVHPLATKPVTRQLQAPHAVSKVSVCHNGGNNWAALRTPADVVLNLGVLNASAGATKWDLETTANYNQVVDSELLYQNQSIVRQDLGITIQLVQPFVHKGTNWIITWRVVAGGNTTDISTPVNLGRSDAELVYMPGHSSLKAPDAAGQYKVSRASDTELLDPTQPLQTLYPNDASSIQAQFRVEIPSLAIDIAAKSPHVGGWLSTLYALPGDNLPIEITVKNDGNTTLYGAAVNFLLGRDLAYVPGSTVMESGVPRRGKRMPEGVIVSNLSQRGINLGTLQPGEQIVIQFNVHVDEKASNGLNSYCLSVVSAADIDYHWNSLLIHME